jgi:hypothetical protein
MSLPLRDVIVTPRREVEMRARNPSHLTSNAYRSESGLRGPAVTSMGFINGHSY